VTIVESSSLLTVAHFAGLVSSVTLVVMVIAWAAPHCSRVIVEKPGGDMGGLPLVARLLLAMVFLLAGVTKFLDRRQGRQSIEAFGVRGHLASVLAVGLPLTELIVAAALISTNYTRWGALGALLLLVGFMVAIGVSLARGRRPNCHCFGQLHSTPVSWTTVIRNFVLAAIAFLVWWSSEQPVSSATAWVNALSPSESIGLLTAVVLVISVVVEGWLILNLLQQQGRLLARLDSIENGIQNSNIQIPPTLSASPIMGLPVGSAAPEFHLVDLNGDRQTLTALRSRGNRVMLVFSDPGCGPCVTLMPEVAEWQRDHTNIVTIAVISTGTLDANRRNAETHGLRDVLIQKGREVADAYRCIGTPSAVMIGSDARITYPAAGGAEAVRTLLAHELNGPPILPLTQANSHGNSRDHAIPATLQVGDYAPDFSLPDLAGRIVTLSSRQGHDTVLLFWNPTCGFCQRMLPTLKAWEAEPPEDAPDLLVVSSGDRDANVALGLASPVLLDGATQLMTQFGATGTPMAVKIDQSIHVASGVLAGASGVMELLNSGKERTAIGPPYLGDSNGRS
jgi:peroxiredoxin